VDCHKVPLLSLEFRFSPGELPVFSIRRVLPLNDPSLRLFYSTSRYMRRFSLAALQMHAAISPLSSPTY